MSPSRSSKGATFLEMVVVIVIIGVLASLGFAHYAHICEKARVDSAKQTLWEIRVAWGQYIMNYRDNDVTFQDLNLTPHEAFPSSCRPEQYFRYGLSRTHAIATRCTRAGKPPQGPRAYEVTLNLENSTWGGTPGYY